MVTRVNQRTQADCLRACVASIFELPYEEVPDFGHRTDPTGQPPSTVRCWDQDVELAEWLAKRGLGFIRLTSPWPFEVGSAARLPWGFCIGEGNSPRGDWRHGVVYDARTCGVAEEPKMIHDPNPSRAGLRGPVQFFVCFVVVEPSRVGR